jgi:hypothetical protein
MSPGRVCFFCVLTITAINVVFGQGGGTGGILGTVTDSSGAVVHKATVTSTNTATSTAFRTSTSSAGDYSAPSLNPGDYPVTVEAQGFEKSRTTSFNLAVDQEIRVDVSMRPGAVNQELVVNSQAIALDTDSAALSQEIGTKQAEEPPLNGRNFFQFLLVGAGPEGNNYTLDGLVNTDQALMTPALILSQDAIGEFKVQSGIYPAENGFGASQINIVSKGGTNSIHGAAYMPLALGKPSGEKFVTFFVVFTLKTCATQSCSGNPWTGQVDEHVEILASSANSFLLFLRDESRAAAQ